MFRKVPTITKNDCYYKNNKFNFSFYLDGMLSSTKTDITTYGLMIHQTPIKIQNYKPNQYINNELTTITFLDNKSPKVNNNKATFVQKYSSNFDKETVYLYVTTIKYNSEFEQSAKDLTYFFGNTLEIPLKLNNEINSNILDYSIIEQILSIKPEQLSAKEITNFALSDLFTTFTDYGKIRNFLFINHSLLCQRKNLNITKILNYRSSIIKRLLKPIINITKFGKKINFETNEFNRFDYIFFDDKYENNIKYDIKINYDIFALSSLLVEIIRRYKISNSKSAEISIMGMINLEPSFYNTYVSFVTKYSKFQNTENYTLLPLFESILQYCDLLQSNYNLDISKSPNKTTDDAVLISKTVQVPFDSSKYFNTNKYEAVNNNLVANITSFNYNSNNKIQIKSKKQLYNILLANQTKAQEPTFNSILNSMSTTITKKQTPFKVSKKIIKNNNLIEDYKITNQKVTINDVFTRNAIDEPKQVIKSQEQQTRDNEQIRNITHKMIGTIDNYLESDSLKLNYYLQFATFNPIDLKNIKWNNLTTDTLRKFNQNTLLFVRLVPEFSDVNTKQDIFNFSYNINQLITTNELLENVT